MIIPEPHCLFLVISMLIKLVAHCPAHMSVAGAQPLWHFPWRWDGSVRARTCSESLGKQWPCKIACNFLYI